MNRPLKRRAGPLLGAFLVVAGAVAALTPVVPGALALDPTPEPSSASSAVPSAAPSAEASVDPTLAPSAEPSAEPSAAPSAEPSAPAPSADPSTDPSASPSAAPSAVPSASPSPDPSAPVPSADPSADPSASPSVAPSATPPSVGLRTTHAWIDTLDTNGKVVATGPLDEQVGGLDRLGTYRVWFQVVNGTDIGIDIGPVLEVAAGISGKDFAAVAAPDFVRGEPFFVTSDDGREDRPRTTALAVGDLRVTSSLDPSAIAVEGMVSTGMNPAGRLDLPAHSFTEVGFTVHVSIDAAWDSGHAFRLTDGGVALSAGVSATARIGGAGPSGLSPGQRNGQDVGDPVPLYRLVFAPKSPASARGAMAFALEPLAGQPGPPYANPHFDLSLASDTCAACHATHTAERAYLGTEPAPVSNVCFTCHDGSGALTNVKAEYTDPNVPANNPATSTWYSHPALATTAHTIDRDDEFSGRSNRHAECADCHQPHLSDSTLGVQTTGGWTASGAIKGASGVAVTNSATPGAAPTYSWQPTSTLEYQLCLKCHSGFTQLTSGARDKGIEFNPANGSYHPVEAKGTNATPKMLVSLNGSSPYKLWNFALEGTVRCTHCHGNPRTREPGTPAANARQAPHTSKYEGVLIANYRRTLKPANQAYAAADFALCYLCHGEAGLTGTNSATNFSFHNKHLRSLGDKGNSICSECHNQVHSSALRPTAQTGSTSRLVVFGPSVTAWNGVISWTSTGVGRGTCTLMCHGKEHDPKGY